MTVYHISTKYLGKTVTFSPRKPLSMADGEPDTLRICVCPTLGGCYRACQVLEPYNLMGNNGFIEAHHVYRAEVDKTYPAKQVTDAKYTGERWLLQPIVFTHVCKIPRIKWKTINKVNWSASYRYRMLSEEVQFLHYRELAEKKRKVTA